MVLPPVKFSSSEFVCNVYIIIIYNLLLLFNKLNLIFAVNQIHNALERNRKIALLKMSSMRS